MLRKAAFLLNHTDVSFDHSAISKALHVSLILGWPVAIQGPTIWESGWTERAPVEKEKEMASHFKTDHTSQIKVTKMREYSNSQLAKSHENYIFQRQRLRKFSAQNYLKIRETGMCSILPLSLIGLFRCSKFNLKIPSEMEVAPRYNCWNCWHCLWGFGAKCWVEWVSGVDTP